MKCRSFTGWVVRYDASVGIALGVKEGGGKMAMSWELADFIKIEIKYICIKTKGR